MIEAFESTVRRNPQSTCFTHVDAVGAEESYSYQEARLYAAAFARVLEKRGVRRGDCVTVDLPNCPAFVFLTLAAAYTGFSLVVINHRLTPAEKLERSMDVEHKHGLHVAAHVDDAMARRLFEQASAILSGDRSVLGDDEGGRGSSGNSFPFGGSNSQPFTTRPGSGNSQPFGSRGSGNSQPFGSSRAGGSSNSFPFGRGGSNSQPFGRGSSSQSFGTSADRYVSPSTTRAARSVAARSHGSTQARASRPSASEREAARGAAPRTDRALGRAGSGRASLRRRDEMARQDAVDGLIHFAEHSSRLFDRGALALVMFTSGTTGRAKAVPLTWENICESAEISNSMLNRFGKGVWQAALPLFHIGGFQVMVRSFLNENPFVLYERFHAERILCDVARYEVTHISVVDRMLQDMTATGQTEALRAYKCILLGGGPVNASTVEKARMKGACVYSSYGMTETSSQIANAPAMPALGGGLRLLPDYDVHIVDPGPDGYGRLAVKGPGVFKGYLNARAAFTVDGYFLTGDTAAMRDGMLYVKERTEDMFVSGGENVYPAEIRKKLLTLEGIADAHVFGVPDDRWGRRPVAFIERDPDHAGEPMLRRVREQLAPQLSKMYMPKHLLAVDEFPRGGIGKLDRVALEDLYEDRIEVRRITLHHIRLPFKQPFKTPKGVLYDRDSLIVEVTDHAGRTGLGECVAFATDWYLPETLEEDVQVLRELLGPLMLRESLLHPRDASLLFDSFPAAQAHPMACGALEPALWDLYSKIMGEPLWRLLGGTSDDPVSPVALVPAGAAIAVGGVEETVAAARACVQAGYPRVKLKVVPGTALACAQAVRSAFPSIMITLDANQSFTERNADELRALDACSISWIEEPLDPNHSPGVGKQDIFARLARLQRTMSTPICLDESITHPRDLFRALSHPELRCYALKIGKFGGVQPSLEFLRMAQMRGLTVWMGGMYDTGVSKRLHAAFETLDAVSAPGDIGAPSRYFDVDITVPPYTVEEGLVALNAHGHPVGLGCNLDLSALDSVLINRIVIE